MEIINKYFADFSETQLNQFAQLQELYTTWNAQINVISRKDMEGLYLKHILHSLVIPTVFDFQDGQKIIDIGTGGGFPGIPLAIYFPQVQFVLADSIKKKLKVVEEIAQALQLKNVKTHWGRVEDIKEKNNFDFAVSRAVAPLNDLWHWAKPLLKKGKHIDSNHFNGLICLKGGDLHTEISVSECNPTMWNIQDFFHEDFFHEKYILYVKR